MSTALGKIIAAVGIGLLVYTGYQAMTYRETLRLTQQEFEGLPLSILWMLAVAVVVSMVGGFQSAGVLKPISLADSPQPIVFRPMNIDFATFNHRGPLLGALKKRAAASS